MPRRTFEADGTAADRLRRAAPETFQSISFAKVLEGEVAAGHVEGKTVIVGASAPILQDHPRDATTSAGRCPGRKSGRTRPPRCCAARRFATPRRWLDVLLIVLLGAARAARAACGVRRWRSLLDALAARRRVHGRDPARVQQRPHRHVRLPAAGARAGHARHAARALRERSDRARARARRVLALRPRGCRRRGSRQRRREPAPRAASSATAPCCSRDLRGFTSFSETQPAAQRDRGRQLLPQRDDRGDPRRRAAR